MRYNNFVKVINEIYLVSFASDAIWYQRVAMELDGTLTPDEQTLKVAQSYGYSKTKVFSHSTSWHYDNSNPSIWLTYVVLQEGVKLDGAKRFDGFLPPRQKALKGQPKRELSEESILRHGLRHMVFLLQAGEFGVSDAAAKALTQFGYGLAGEV